MGNLNKNNDIKEESLKFLMEEAYKTIAPVTITQRALPDVRDGLTPVHRRIIFTMGEGGFLYNKPYKKSARIVGNVMGKYHPHGDSSIYGAEVKLSQDWVKNVPLVSIQGNNGSIDGDPPADMRYTEARLTEIASEHIVKNLKVKEAIKWKLNYDDTLEEPTVLPLDFPNLVINGASGVAMSYATSTLPNNLSETMKALIMIASDEGATYEDIIKVLPAPDFPTGGIIINGSELPDIMYKGRGVIKVRSQYKIQKVKDSYRIIFTDVPYGTKVSNLLNQITDSINKVTKDGKPHKDRLLNIDEVIDDSNSKEGVKLIFNLKKGADPKVVLSNIFAKTGLLKKIPMNNTVIIDGKPKENVSFLVLLKEFHKFRLNVIQKEFEFKLRKLNRDLEITNGYIKAGKDLDNIIKLIRSSEGKKDAKNKLIEYGFTELQSDSVLSLGLHQLPQVNFIKEEDKKVDLEGKVSKIKKLLGSEANINKLAIKRYIEFEEKYKTERKTRILPKDEDWKAIKVEEVLDEDVYVSVSYRGNTKRSSVRSFGSTKGEFKLLDNQDKLVFSGKVNGKDSLIFITNKMRYLYIPVIELDDLPWKDNGKNIALKGSQLESDEFIQSVIVDDGINEDNILSVVDNGGIKLNSIEGMRKKQQYFKVNKFTSLKKDKKERLLFAVNVGKIPSGYLGFSDKKGRSMYFNISELEPKGKGSGYIKGFGIPKGTEKVESAEFSKDKEPIEYKYIHERERGKVGKKTVSPSEDLEIRYKEYLDSKNESNNTEEDSE